MTDANTRFADYAASFRGVRDIGWPLLNSASLSRDVLDFSVESTREVDRYLETLRPVPSQFTPEWVATILQTGAYVGEVIRQHSSETLTWTPFDDFVAQHPEVLPIIGSKKNLAVDAVLTDGTPSFTLPINRIVRYLHNGSEDSVWFYVSGEVKSSTSAAVGPSYNPPMQRTGAAGIFSRVRKWFGRGPGRL